MKRIVVILFPVICVAVLLISWGLLHAPAAGEAADLPEEGAYGQPAEMAGMALRVVLALGLILLLLVGAVYALRMLGGRNGARLRGSIEVLDRCYLAPKRALYTVRMAGRVVVVGVTENTITPVLELSPEEGDERYPDIPSAPDESGRFSNILRAVTGKVARLQV